MCGLLIPLASAVALAVPRWPHFSYNRKLSVALSNAKIDMHSSFDEALPTPKE